MKRILTLVLFGSLTASLLTAQARSAPTQFSSPVLDEVARLSAGGASDATILAFLHARRARRAKLRAFAGSKKDAGRRATRARRPQGSQIESVPVRIRYAR